jgi:SAM-dependent methyltransferase
VSDARDLWDAEAADFDEPADHGLGDPQVRAAWRELLLGALPPTPARVADLGCGTATLTQLLAEEGYAVDAVDFSPAMVELARAKVAGLEGVTVTEGDAGAPPLEAAAYDVVLCRHVLWALADQVEVLRRWSTLLKPGGRLVLVEGNWSNGAGLTAEDTVRLLSGAGRPAEVRHLTEAVFWGREITDERYLVISR